MQQVPAHLADELLEQDVEDDIENVIISSEEMVLMQTAKGNILNPTNGMHEDVRMLFDSGSQRTYITEKLARKLKLKLGKKREQNCPGHFRIWEANDVKYAFHCFKHGAKGWQCFKINCKYETRYNWINAETLIQYQLPTKLGIPIERQCTCRYFAKWTRKLNNRFAHR